MQKDDKCGEKEVDGDELDVTYSLACAADDPGAKHHMGESVRPGGKRCHCRTEKPSRRREKDHLHARSL